MENKIFKRQEEEFRNKKFQDKNANKEKKDAPKVNKSSSQIIFLKNIYLKKLLKQKRRSGQKRVDEKNRELILKSNFFRKGN